MKAKINDRINSKLAFSLIEISVVILVIGILIAGISKGMDLYQDFKLSTARSLTMNSRVGRIPDLVVWWESTLEKSFDKSEMVNNTPITNWYDSNPMAKDKYSALMSNANYKPKYNSSGINGLPSVKLDGTDYLSATSFKITGNKLTYFVVSKRNAIATHASTFIGIMNGVTHDFSNINSFVGFYEFMGGSLRSYVATDLSDGTHPGNNVPYIASSNFSGTNNIVRVSGKSFPAVNTSPNFNVNILYIGCRFINGSVEVNSLYNGEIGEIIIFSRDLNNNERQEVEKYLSQKWGIKLVN